MFLRLPEFMHEFVRLLILCTAHYEQPNTKPTMNRRANKKTPLPFTWQNLCSLFFQFIGAIVQPGKPNYPFCSAPTAYAFTLSRVDSFVCWAGQMGCGVRIVSMQWEWNDTSSIGTLAKLLIGAGSSVPNDIHRFATVKFLLGKMYKTLHGFAAWRIY